MEKFKNDSLLASLISSYMRSLKEGVFTTRTVGELLWGYEDALLNALHAFKPELDDVFGLFYKVSFTHTLHIDVYFVQTRVVILQIWPLSLHEDTF